MELGRDLKKMLVVDPDPAIWREVQRACGHQASIVVCGDFTTARQTLVHNPPDILVTNLRLGAYNGLHLVYLAATNANGTRAIVYGQVMDLSLIREALGLGAFFESRCRLASALSSYLSADLPEHDRRLPREFERRTMFRGGRRAADVVAATP